MSAGPQARDFVGYAGNPPHPRWPKDARIAVNFVLNYEEGSEPSIPDGEPASETAMTEASTGGATFKGRNLAAEGMYEYGSRVGFWRVLRMFQERGLPLTVFGAALALERNPAACAAIAAAGYDVCAHGWRWVKHHELTEDEERTHIRRAVESLSRTLGERPLGWYCRYGPSLNTRRLLAEEGGFVYDSDAYNDELPYWVRVGAKPHLVVPYSLANNDAKFVLGGFSTAEDYFTFQKDGFDLLYREGRTLPKMISFGLHMRVIGHPSRCAGLERLLDYVMQRPAVWICRRLDIARHWIETHPYRPIDTRDA